ncbi:protein-glutamate O-methyltransferase CheR [Dechloromonas denitrificans]|uniref:CheR family methyltransferase n=1 Tax=Dechloromonas denitrificans TaxID=281362 RepID=UPI001CF8A550|nr:protein-glutamate O-methyltransferase CheR [Dechloromonas denitrificans]UCV11223.1 protein-glutamate O-methyltransferase CheR [Dechloromonas denitrificans]
MAQAINKTSGSSEFSLGDSEFQLFRKLIYQQAGISLSDAKKPLVAGRLSKRLRQLGIGSYIEYFRLVQRDIQELQVTIDLLTTNETYFFRENKHFDFLRDQILPGAIGRGPFRVWSGACSSGEEPYTIAMVLAEVLGQRPWEIVASDLSTRVLEEAAGGLYPLTDCTGIPRHLLHKHCLRGIGQYDGSIMINPALRERISFRQINLNNALPKLGAFDVIFLRNVMIYFDIETKRQVIKRILPLLRPGGYFMISHSESLNGVTDALKSVRPSIYRKPDA